MEIPRDFNAATWFVDRHVAEGRAAQLAVIHEGGRLTYGDVAAGTNPLRNAVAGPRVQRGEPRGPAAVASPQVRRSFWGRANAGRRPLPPNPPAQPPRYRP